MGRFYSIRRPLSPAFTELWHTSQLYWLTILVVAGWLILRAFGIPHDAPPVQWHFCLLALALAVGSLSLRTYFSARWQGDRHRSAPGVFTVVDFAIIAMGLRATGGLATPLWVLLFLIVVGETIIAEARAARLVRWAAGIALVAGTAPIPFYAGEWMVDMAMRLFFLTLVSILTRRLRVQAAQVEAQLTSEIAATNERGKLSREIHDQVGNTLAGAVLHLEVTARVLQKQAADDATVEVLREEAAGLRAAMNKIREWTFLSRSWGVEDAASPADALAHEVNRLSLRTGIPMIVVDADLLNDLPAIVRLSALRIVQEALTNAIKYARGCTRVQVVVQRERGFVVLQVIDDGCGFDPSDPSAALGVGVQGMRERAELLHGSLTVQSAAGQGVTVTARLPS